MQKIKSTEEYELNVADLEALIREKHLTHVPENAKITIVPNYQSYYDEQVFRGMKITIESKGE